MNEIGGEFWEIPISKNENNIFPNNTQWYLSGRNALCSIIEQIGDKHTVAIPSWCCDSMIEPFINAGYEVHFYPVIWDGQVKQKITLDCDVLLELDYFGYSTNSAKNYNYNGVIIRDLTHSILSGAPKKADYYFGSLRKWCGFPTGGFAWANDGTELKVDKTTNGEYIHLRKIAMEQKNEYIHGKRGDKQFLQLFKQAEELLSANDTPASGISDINKAKQLDVKTIKNQRRSNAEVLISSLNELVMFPQVNSTDCPLFVPIIVPNGKRDELHKYLIEKNIYCPIHWPITKFHNLDKRESYIYENEISLICDQRYNKQDMIRIVDTIKQFWRTTLCH